MKNGLKKFLAYISVGVVFLVVGIVFTILRKSNPDAMWMTIVMVIGYIGAIGGVVLSISGFRDGVRATCPGCKTLYKNSPDTTYNFQCTSSEPKYDQQGKQTDTLYYFAVQIVCGNCGETREYVDKIRAKNAAAASVSCERHIKNIIKNNM